MPKVLEAYPPFNSRVLWLTVGSVVALPMCFLDQEKLSFTSTFAIIVNIYLFGAVVYFALASPAEADPSLPICNLAFTKGSVAMFSLLMMAIIIQMCVLPMYKTLEDRSVEKFRTIVKKSFAFLFFLFAGFFYMSLVAFGEHVPSDVLTSFPPGTA